MYIKSDTCANDLSGFHSKRTRILDQWIIGVFVKKTIEKKNDRKFSSYKERNKLLYWNRHLRKVRTLDSLGDLSHLSESNLTQSPRNIQHFKYIFSYIHFIRMRSQNWTQIERIAIKDQRWLGYPTLARDVLHFVFAKGRRVSLRNCPYKEMETDSTHPAEWGFVHAKRISKKYCILFPIAKLFEVKR